MRCACTARAETCLPPVPPIKATSTWKSAPIATHSLPASRNFWIPPGAWSATAASTRRPPRNNAVGFFEGLRRGGGLAVLSRGEARDPILATNDLLGGQRLCV